MKNILIVILTVTLLSCNSKQKGIIGKWKGTGEKLYEMKKSIKYMSNDSIVSYNNITANFKKDTFEINGFDKKFKSLYEMDNHEYLRFTYADKLTLNKMTVLTMDSIIHDAYKFVCEKYELKDDSLKITFRYNDDSKYKIILTRVE